MCKISKQKLIVLIALGLTLIIALSIGILVMLRPKKVPVSAEYITVTIDSSVSASFTLDINDYSVIKAETFNRAYSFLVDDINSRISFTQAMNSFIKEMLDAKKLYAEESEIFLFSVESRNEDDFEKLANHFRSALKENNCSSRIQTLYFKVKELSISTYAEKNNVSYAKSHLCKRIEKETKLKADDLISLSITEIIDRVNASAKQDLLDRIESETIEQQKKEEIKEESSAPVSSDDSSSVPSTENSIPSQSAPSSGETSSDSSSSDNSSGGTTSSGPSFSVDDSDDSDWSEIV